MFRIALACLIVCLTTGCASIVNGQNQSVTVTTRASGTEVPGAKCTLTNDKGKWYTATPGSVVVRRSYGELAVNCTHEAHEAGAQSFKSATKAMAFGNAIFGGVIGVAVDVSTGAAYDYPEALQVTLGGAASKTPGGPDPAAPVAAGLPAPPPTRIGTRYVMRDLDAVSGMATGESSLTLTTLSATESEFNDGAVTISLTGQRTRNATGAGAIVGIRVADLVQGSRTSASFVPGGGADTVPLALDVGLVESLPDALGGLRVARVQVSGLTGLGSAGAYPNSQMNGEAMIDLDTGLVLSAHVKSRANNYTLRRELVKVIRPAAPA